ncbi:unnamed protein product, partial [Symbiodinium necroappetens]
MHQAKRTLRDARARQHEVRLSRQYYKTSSKGAGRGRGQSTGTKDDSNMTCLRCGKVGHRVANCPHPPAASAQATTTPEATSSFICFNDCATNLIDAYAMGVLTTTDAVRQGKAVVDGGATRTLASIEAMEAIMQINQGKRGKTGLATLDMLERPVFGFGNSSENQCASTAHLQILANNQSGKLKVHCLDHGSGPLLLSVETLSPVEKTEVQEVTGHGEEVSVGCHLLLPVTKYAVTRADHRSPKANPLEAIQLQTELQALQLQLLATEPAMYRKTKAELVAELRKYQEHPAPGWTKVEIRQRLLELQGQEEEEAHKKTSNATALQNITREMRKASKNKANLIVFCEQELEMTLTGNETKPQLEMKAMNKILANTPPEGMDVVGFGKHVDRRYHEMLDELRGYGEWVVQTAGENPSTSDPRLRRLAGWLEPRLQTGSSTMHARGSSSMEAPWMTGRTIAKTPAKAATKAFLKPKNDPSESTTSSPEVVADQTKKMDEMAEMIHKLKDELESMKAEPRRKQAGYADEDSMTDRSFVQ